MLSFKNSPIRAVALAALGTAMFATVHCAVGRIEVGGGAGWDGGGYERMLTAGWSAGTIHTQARPLVVWVNWPAFRLTGSAVRAFDAMNYAYAFLLAYFLARLLDRYGASFLDSAAAIACIFLSIAVSRMHAYYPVLIDLGALAVIAMAVWFIVSGRRVAACFSCVAAVLAREYAPAVVLFGIHRDLRHRTSWRTVALTYLPALFVWAAIRGVVTRRWAGIEDGYTLALFFEQRRFWNDPMFAALFGYFFVTVLGGVSLVTFAQPFRWWPLVRKEHEWVTYMLPIAAAAALASFDIWRYLAALAPAVVVLFAYIARDWKPLERVVMLGAMVGLTFWSQRPLRSMNLFRYFADWFPYYIWKNEWPLPPPPPVLWPEWAWRFVGAASALYLVAAVSAGFVRRADKSVKLSALPLTAQLGGPPGTDSR